jgi:hypothetical protein
VPRRARPPPQKEGGLPRIGEREAGKGAGWIERRAVGMGEIREIPEDEGEKGWNP